jgi:hypothetical protein
MKADLPNGSQFSPEQVSLPRLLLMVKALEPDRAAIIQAIVQAFHAQKNDPLGLAENTTISMAEYGIVSRPRDDQGHLSLTEFGRELVALAEEGKDADLYSALARHILLNLRGLDLITCAADIAAAGHRPTKARIVKELAYRGIYHPPNGTHANSMRQWLELAGLMAAPGGWVADSDRLAGLLGGVTEHTLEAYADLTREQIDFAKAFARLGVDEALSNKVQQYATALYGTEFPEGGLPQSVLFALGDAGLIEYTKTTGGRGAKPYIIRPTDQLRGAYLEPILTALEESIGLQYRKLIRLPYHDILAGLDSGDKNASGRALEALAFYLARLLNLRFVQWRMRGAKTGGGEVDVVMEGAHLIFSRWQIQCKVGQADLDDVAKEVGLAQVIKANVILVVSNKRIGPVARQFAEQVMRETNLYVALLDGNDLATLRDHPAEIAAIMNAQAEGALTIKREQVMS